MALNVKQLLERALILLQDEGAVRWKIPELVDWLNEGVRHALDYKPDLATSRASISLDPGVDQSIPVTMRRVVRFRANTVSGKAIRLASPELMDRYIPSWRSTSAMGSHTDVIHAITDEADDSTFQVYPPNDGTGSVDVLAVMRPSIVAPEAGQEADDLASYDEVDVPLEDAAGDALLDYVVSRAYSKDTDIPGAAQRAQMHYQAFASKMGITVQSEQVLNAETPARDPEA